MEPYGTKRDHLGPTGAIQGHTEPNRAIPGHMGPYGSIWGILRVQFEKEVHLNLNDLDKPLQT